VLSSSAGIEADVTQAWKRAVRPVAGARLVGPPATARSKKVGGAAEPPADAGASLDEATDTVELHARETTDTAPATAGSVSGHAIVTLRSDEAARTVGFARTVCLITSICLMWLPFLGGDALARLATALTLGPLCALSAWLWRCIGTRMSTRIYRLFAMSCVFASFVIQYYVGIFSPAPLVVTMGVAFFGLGEDRVSALAAPLAAMAGFIVLSGLITVGVLDDRGLVSSSDVALETRLFLLCMVPIAHGASLLVARWSRAATMQAMDRMSRATRLAQLREAQFHEANQNLDLALRAGVGQTGRYSGQMVGRYLLSEVIGRGAMGEVYAAMDVASGRHAAVKLLHAAALDCPGIVERFTREADIICRLSAPNVVGVYHVGRTPEGAPFMAMERLQGVDLATRLRAGPLPIAEAVQMVTDIARGLEAAHRKGIVHRDLKPQNLFFDERRGVWMILDFGISKLKGTTGTLTRGEIIGTPGYMSPEQAQGLDVDARSDVFSLGAVVYRAITGRPPFSGPDPLQIVLDVAFRNPACPTEIAPSLPADIDLMLAVALAKDRQERFVSATELVEGFRSALRGTLEGHLRDRGERILAKYPWGRAERTLVQLADR
jgi:serine/threonine-protein kinase